MLSNNERFLYTILPDNVLLWVVAFLLLLQVATMLLLILNIRRKRRVEDIFQTSQIQSREILESSPVGICIVSNRRFVYVNQTYIKMFGYSHADEIVGRFVEELYTPEERLRQRRFAKDRAASKPAPTAYDTKGLRKDGSRFDVASRVSLIQYEGLPSSLGFVIDRSVDKQLRSQLEQKNRLEAIGTLAGGIAHDFNNILTAIIGYTQIATHKLVKNTDVKNDLSQVLQASQRAKELVQQILLYSRNQEGQQQVIRLISVVQEVLKLVRATLPKSIEIKTDLQSEALILGDPGQIHQLLMNLCANAEYVMRRDGGCLKISLSDHFATDNVSFPYPGLVSGEYLCLSVSDNGPGVPQEIREKIFEPFFTTKVRGEGTGMGLAQVHGITVDHSGFIFLDDVLPHGARFSLLLPVAKDDESAIDHDSTEIPRGIEKILVVDDEEMVVQVTSQILSDLGYDVTTSQNSPNALAIFKDHPYQYDLVVSDMTMPYLTGEKLAQEMLTIRPNLPFVICTGFNATINEAEASKLGIQAFLEKPVSREKLAQTVRSLLDEV